MAEERKIRREEVANAAGVSKAVVTWVMDGSAKDRRISEATIKKVQNTINELNYRPSIWGKLINSQKSGLVAFISSDLSDPNTGEIIRNINLSMRRHGYGLMLFDLYGAGTFAQEHIIRFEDCFAEAFILHIPDDNILEFCSEGQFAGKPFCVLGRNMKDELFPSVEVDNVKGVEMGLDILLKQEISSIGIIGDLQSLQYTQERLEGCRNFLKSFINIKTDFYFRKPSESQYETGANAIKNWVSSSRLPDAVFAMGDVMALGALSEINTLQIKCPEKIRIMGFDGTAFSEYSSPPLTTVRQPFENMCEKAAEICVAGIKGEKLDNVHYLLSPKLIIRKTV